LAVPLRDLRICLNESPLAANAVLENLFATTTPLTAATEKGDKTSRSAARTQPENSVIYQAFGDLLVGMELLYDCELMHLWGESVPQSQRTRLVHSPVH